MAEWPASTVRSEQLRVAGVCRPPHAAIADILEASLTLTCFWSVYVLPRRAWSLPTPRSALRRLGADSLFAFHLNLAPRVSAFRGRISLLVSHKPSPAAPADLRALLWFPCLPPFREFDAEIAILTHSTTIQPRYQAVIHCEIIRQAATVVRSEKD